MQHATKRFTRRKWLPDSLMMQKIRFYILWTTKFACVLRHDAKCHAMSSWNVLFFLDVQWPSRPGKKTRKKNVRWTSWKIQCSDSWHADHLFKSYKVSHLHVTSLKRTGGLVDGRRKLGHCGIRRAYIGRMWIFVDFCLAGTRFFLKNREWIPNGLCSLKHMNADFHLNKFVVCKIFSHASTDIVLKNSGPECETQNFIVEKHRANVSQNILLG